MNYKKILWIQLYIKTTMNIFNNYIKEALLKTLKGLAIIITKGTITLTLVAILIIVSKVKLKKRKLFI